MLYYVTEVLIAFYAFSSEKYYNELKDKVTLIYRRHADAKH